MHRNHPARISWLIGLVAAMLTTVAGAEPRLVAPDGFDVSVWAADVPNARQMAVVDDGLVFVGSRRKGSVHAVFDDDGDRVADRTLEIASGLNLPSGVTLLDGTLYIGAVDKIYAIPDAAAKARAGTTDNYKIGRGRFRLPGAEILTDDLPRERHHGWKYLKAGPDGRLYANVGAPCNICNVDGLFATIITIAPDSGAHEVYARGIRNTVGFDWDPHAGRLWFTDNGRDWLGDDLPPEELNVVTTPGQHFGYPWLHGGDVQETDDEVDPMPAGIEPVAPVLKMVAHSAPLGIHFYRGSTFPAEFRGLFIAQHGSWNRSSKVGYRVLHVPVAADGTVGEPTPFLTGFLREQETLGRPNDVVELSDGSLLVSDDHQGAIYRVSYRRASEPLERAPGDAVAER